MSKRFRAYSGLVVIVLAAVFMEAILAFQYNYAKKQLEKEVEYGTMMDLVTASLRIQGVLSDAEVAASSQLIHAERHLSNTPYLQMMLSNMVQNTEDFLIGAGIGFASSLHSKNEHWNGLYIYITYRSHMTFWLFEVSATVFSFIWL